MTVATEAQLRAVAGAALARDDGRVLAVYADAEWHGPPVLDTAVGPVRVVVCPSPLAVRDALANHRAVHGRLAVLTPCGEHDLGLDVLARLVGGKVRRLDPWSTVLALFGATGIDPLLARQHRWLVEELVALAPGTGYGRLQPLSGVLELDTAWAAFHAQRFGVDSPPSSFAEVLRLAGTARVGEALAALPAEQRAQLGARWRRHAKDPIDGVLAVAAGSGRADLVPLGLVLRIVGDDPADAALAPLAIAARARLEQHLPAGPRRGPEALRWAAAAEEALGQAEPLEATAWLDRAAALVDEVGARPLSWRSDVLLAGFEQRRDHLGEAIVTVLNGMSTASGGSGAAGLSGPAGRAIAAMEAAMGQVADHRLAKWRHHVVEAARAAVRLTRRAVASPLDEPSSFAVAAGQYRADLAWVDRARDLLHDGDSAPQLGAAYSRLLDRLADERERSNARFAKLLAEWSRSEPATDERIVPLEEVLSRVVAEAATAAGPRPVLVVVFDGLSLPVATRLDEDLEQHGWQAVAPGTRSAWPVGVAMLPTVTDVSRASLLCGRRVTGTQPVERDGFSTNAALAALGGRPVLYHKADLTGPGGNALPPEVLETVASDAVRVVGAVVNAVDDHLARGQQVRVDWTVDAIGPLGWLLEAAAEADRVVVVVSDHGHVLDRGMTYRPVRDGESGGERWRPAGGAGEPGEIEIAGPRVLRGGGRVVLAWDERLCFGANKHGYHGGVTPQEVLVPVATYVRAGRIPDGWEPLAPAAPSWWHPPADSPAGFGGRARGESTSNRPDHFDEQDESAGRSGTTAGRSKGRGRKPAPSPQEPTLFPVVVLSAGVWIDELLQSEIFIRQRRRNPRQDVPDGVLRQVFGAFEQAGWTATSDALSAATGINSLRLGSQLTGLRRLLNLDGYEVLAEQNKTFRLDRTLLRQQFGVDA